MEVQILMSNLEFKIGKVDCKLSEESPPRQYFIVTQEEDGFSYHAMKIGEECRYHQNIVQAIERDDAGVLGGGIVAYRDGKGELELFSKSNQYGGLDKAFMENFREKLFRTYKEFLPNLKNILIDTSNKPGFF